MTKLKQRIEKLEKRGSDTQAQIEVNWDPNAGMTDPNVIYVWMDHDGKIRSKRGGANETTT